MAGAEFRERYAELSRELGLELRARVVVTEEGRLVAQMFIADVRTGAAV